QTEASDDFPRPNYPDALPAKPVDFAERLYDPNDPSDVYFYAGVFRCAALTTRQFRKAVEFVVAEGLWDYELDTTGCETAEEYLREGAGSPFAQGTPEDGCPAKGCRLHKRVGSLRVFALYQEAEKNSRKIWGPNGENLEITYQLCPACGAVLVQNQCT